MDAQINQIMNSRVPTLTVAFIVVSLVLGFITPLVIAFFLRKKYKANYPFALAGCAVWIVFAMVLKQIAQTLIFITPAGNAILNNPILLGLFGGAMAGIFEEVGRFTAFSTIFKKKLDNDKNALMYGAGHGGIECILILGFSMISNLAIVLMINNGMTSQLIEPLKTLDPDTAQSTVNSLIQVIEYPSWMFLVGILERFAAMASHIAMSVPVWFAVKNKKISLLFVAIGMHFVLDAGSVIFNSLTGENVLLVEGLIYLFAIAFVFIAYMIYKNNSSENVAMN